MATSVSILNGFDGFKLSDLTFAANAPGAGDIELRFNATDGAGNAITRKALVIALMAFTRAIESGPLFTTSPPL